MVGVTEALNYVLYTNPVSSNAGKIAKTAASAVANYSGLQPKVEYKMAPPAPLWKLAASSGPYLKLAGLSGATAVILGAYGAHTKFKNPELKVVFESANKYHFYHSLAMMGLSVCRVPMLTAAFWVSGSVMFCGSCYYYAFTGNDRFNKVTPMGGTCFILGWLTLCL